jgi:4-amino-4-deoxy-L-arabinose transferase-like glycosyltransferase
VELRGFGHAGLARTVTQLAAGLGTLTALRLLAAATIPLAPDEAYYWVWSHALAPGYLDHPPMVALWIRVGTALLGQTALGVRLLAPVSTLLASVLLFDAGRVLFDPRRAAWAVLLLNATLLLGVGAVIMTPDTPLLFFWTLALWAAARIAAGGGGLWWLAAGLFGGLALDSKYTALFLWIGVGAWVLLHPKVRFWLGRWQPWAAIVIGLVLFAPVLAWNAAYHWASFARQGGRLADWRPARAAQFLAELVGGQIALATPLIFALCLGGLAASWRRRHDPRWALLLALSLPSIIVFVQHALGDRVQGDWPAIIYPALALGAAGWSARIALNRAAVALGFGITLAVYAQAGYPQAGTRLIPLPPRLDPIAHQLSGWPALEGQLSAAARETGARTVAVVGYAPASELAWLAPAGLRLIGIDPHWTFTTLPRIAAPAGGLLLRDARDFTPPDPGRWGASARVGLVQRSGIPGGTFAVYRVEHIPQGVLLPGRG